MPKFIGGFLALILASPLLAQPVFQVRVERLDSNNNRTEPIVATFASGSDAVIRVSDIAAAAATVPGVPETQFRFLRITDPATETGPPQASAGNITLLLDIAFFFPSELRVLISSVGADYIMAYFGACP